MKKKKPAAHAIPSAQLDALRRLASAGKIQDALARLDALKRDHPDFKPLYGLAWELASMAQTPYWAAERAWDWTRVSPNSPSAWQALADAALASGYFALGLSAQDHLATLAGQSVPTHEDFDTPFGKMRFLEALANDTARMFMAVAHYDQALAPLAGFDHISLRNNAALIRFQQGDMPAALAAFEENCQREPRNLFALSHLVRLRLWTRGLDAAAELAAPIKAIPPMRVEDALSKIHALLVLADWQGADAAWRESTEADFWQDQETAVTAAFDLAGGIAALRLGDFETMSERLGAAAEDQPEWRDFVHRIEFAAVAPQLGDAPDITLGALPEWFPQAWINRLTELKAVKGKASETRYDALMLACDAHPDYLSIAAELSGEAGRFLAISILKRRAGNGDEAARQALIALLVRPCGADKVRTGLHADLVEAGLLPEGGTVSMWVQGGLREIRHLALTLHAEPSPPDLPPESHARLKKVFDLMAEKKLTDCLPILEALIAAHPDVASLYANLAGIKEGLRHPDDDIEALMKKALALDPDYLFAIAGLARLAARRGEIDRAAEMIKPLLDLGSYHFTEWRAILMTQQEMAKQKGELGTSLTIQKQIEDLQERFG